MDLHGIMTSLRQGDITPALECVPCSSGTCCPFSERILVDGLIAIKSSSTTDPPPWNSTSIGSSISDWHSRILPTSMRRLFTPVPTSPLSSLTIELKYRD